MALTLRSNGNNPINIVSASWFNDFYNLLTGAMNDQPVSLKYVPASGSTPALTLTSKAGNPLLKGFQPDGVTQAFLIDEVGNLTLNGFILLGPVVGGVQSQIFFNSGLHILQLSTPQAGAANGVSFGTWDGAAGHIPFSIGGQFNGAVAYVDNSGNINTGGLLSFGVPVSGSQAFLRLTAGLVQLATPQAGAASGHVFNVWNGSASANIFSVGGQLGGAIAWVDNNGGIIASAFGMTAPGGGIPMTRNGAVVSVPIYTGTSTPSNPPTGSIWVKA